MNISRTIGLLAAIFLSQFCRIGTCAETAISPETIAQANEHYARGKRFEAQGNYNSACPEFDAAVGLNPRFGKAYLCVGVCYSKKGMGDQAIEAYRKALSVDIDPYNAAAAHHDMGAEYLKKGQSRLATDEFRAALKVKPDFSPAKSTLIKLGALNSLKYLFPVLIFLFVFWIKGGMSVLFRKGASSPQSSDQPVRGEFPSISTEKWKPAPGLELPKPRTVSSSFPKIIWLVLLLPLTIFGLQWHLGDHLARLYVLGSGVSSLGVVESSFSERAYRYSADFLRFSYQTSKGLQHGQALIDSSLLTLPKGYSLKIHYLPSQPERVVLDDDGGKSIFDLILAGVFLLVLFFVVMRVRLRNQKTQHILSIGDVVPAEVERIEPDRNCSWVHVRFKYQNEMRQAKTRANRATIFAPGNVITLVIDPDDPQSVVAYAECGYRIIGSSV